MRSVFPWAVSGAAASDWPAPATWSLDAAWGEIVLERTKAVLRVLHRTLTLSSLALDLAVNPETVSVALGRRRLPCAYRDGAITFEAPTTIGEGESLRVSARGG